ncbi:hypothetical protein C3F00_039670, partial [Pseudomonas sp. MWU13-2860]
KKRSKRGRCRGRLQGDRWAVSRRQAGDMPPGTREYSRQAGDCRRRGQRSGSGCRPRQPAGMQRGIKCAPGSLFFRDAQPRLNAMRLNFSYFDPLQQHNGVAMLAEVLSGAD